MRRVPTWSCCRNCIRGPISVLRRIRDNSTGPNRSPVLAEANGNRIVLDLMRDPNIGNNPLVRRAVALLTSFVTLHGVETDSKHLDIAFRALPTGLGGAVKSVRNNVVLPSMSRLLPRTR